MTLDEKIIEFLQNEINQKHIPGAVIQVTHKGNIVFQDDLGWRIDFKDKQERMNVDTVFDLASLTKIIATLPAILKLIDEGRIALGDPVSYFLPNFKENGKENIKISHLLTHTSGLASHHRFYKENLTKDEIFKKIEQETLAYPTGTKVIYSDLGFMLLGRIVEIVAHESFAGFTQKKILEPLEMVETGFLPRFSKKRYAATEYDEQLGIYKLGVVHDENANALGGVSGHAGLFSTLTDLSKFAEMIQNNGVYKEKRILSSQVVELSKQNLTPFADENRGLGWQLKSGFDTSCGDYFAGTSYGHTGFTGTSIWFDPTVDLNVILLTNRVHYGREEHILRLRPRLHNIIRQYF